MGLSAVSRAAKLFGTPDFKEVKQATNLRLRDDQVAVDLYASSTKTISTIDGATTDGAWLMLRGFAGTSNITFDENGNILLSGGSSVVGPADTLLLRYDKAAATWHELVHIQH